MSLLRLLAAGKSLIGLKQGSSRYRLSGGKALPQFGANRGTLHPRSDPKPAPCGQSPAQAASAPATPEAKPRRMASWFGRLKSSQRPERGFSAPKPLPIQGELTLERVKVVRNDLSDADLEVQPAERSGERPSKIKAAAKIHPGAQEPPSRGNQEIPLFSAAERSDAKVNQAPENVRQS